MEDILRVSEMLSAVKWYFELKNLSLRNAISLRCPLSVENQRYLRQYYSQYFAGLLSATELFLENEYSWHIDFKEKLHEKLEFEGYIDGEKNYSYLRELRNSIIHRGLDIISAAHIENDFPMIISPSPVSNRSGTIVHTAFGYYLIEIIEKCERVIGDVFLEHIEKFGLLQMQIPQENAVALSKKFISDSTAIPEWVKGRALKSVDEINYKEIHLASVKSLVDTLKTNILVQHLVQPRP